MLVDIALDENNDLRFVDNDLRFINGIYYVKQKIKIRLQWFLGEWYLNTDLGLPYLTEILTKNPNRLAVVNYIKRQIANTEGVKSVDSFNVDFVTGNSRALKIDSAVTTSYGRLSFSETFTVT
jgi:hypothetical protein